MWLLLLSLVLPPAVDSDPPITPYDDLTGEEMAWLVDEASRWIAELEHRHRPHARPLDAAERRALAGFFDPSLLDRARLWRVEGIDNPDFFSLFTDSGRPLPIDFRRITGLALVDTVLVVASRARPGTRGWLPLVFHELVHLAQVEVLGERGHVADYVRGWASHGFRYRTIPQEEQAYELAARFAAAPERVFAVMPEVRRRFAPADR